MPLSRKEGKDTIIFASKEDHAAPSKIDLPESEPREGLILSDGTINWNCPCLGGMPTGPCGVEFREAFSCFHYSTADPKGSDCHKAFEIMHGCMSQYPTLYESKGASMDDDDEDLKEVEAEGNQSSASSEDNRKAVTTDHDTILKSKTEQKVNASSTKQEVERAKTN